MPKELFEDVGAAEDRERLVVRRLALLVGQYVVIGLVVAAGMYYNWQRDSAFAVRGKPVVAVIPFSNGTASYELNETARLLGANVVAQLAAPHHHHQLAVIRNVPALRSPLARDEVRQLRRQFGADYLIVGQLQSDGPRLRLVAHFIRARDMKQIWTQPFDDPEFRFYAQHRTAQRIADKVVASLTAD